MAFSSQSFCRVATRQGVYLVPDSLDGFRAFLRSERPGPADFLTEDRQFPRFLRRLFLFAASEAVQHRANRPLQELARALRGVV